MPDASASLHLLTPPVHVDNRQPHLLLLFLLLWLGHVGRCYENVAAAGSADEPAGTCSQSRSWPALCPVPASGSRPHFRLSSMISSDSGSDCESEAADDDDYNEDDDAGAGCDGAPQVCYLTR